MLRSAVADLSLLLTRGYAEKSSIKLVGDRHRLTVRQRLAVQRAACSDDSLSLREQQRLPTAALVGMPVLIDGYNILITVESALSGGAVFVGRDGAYRDLAGIHGTYRKVEETLPAIRLIGESLSELGIAEVSWFLDSPVSNSGRLKTILLEQAESRQWNWRVEVVTNPDTILNEARDAVVTTDSWILDHGVQWINFAEFAVANHIQGAWVISLAESG